MRVEPLTVGRSIVATWEPNETTVLEAIRELGLDLQIIFNKGAVMVLPSGMNKAAGLAAALRELELSPHNVVGVGDAENDHAFLRACGCAAAVANALPTVKETADISLARRPWRRRDRADRSASAATMPESSRRGGTASCSATTATARRCSLEPYRGSILISGSSGIGKSTLATALTERMTEKGFEFCVFDPEGDYDELENAVSIGDAKTPPQPDEAIKLLETLGTNVVVNTQAPGCARAAAILRQRCCRSFRRCGRERDGRIGCWSMKPITCSRLRARTWGSCFPRTCQRRFSSPCIRSRFRSMRSRRSGS